MLKGIVKINRVLDKFLEPFDCTADLGTDFCYIYSESKIEYALVESEQSIADFMGSVNRLHPRVKADCFLWSFLHELGHNETMNEMTDEEIDESEAIKEKIEKGELSKFAYYDTVEERLATEWAVEYAETHTEELLTFWNKLQKAIMDFYKENNIEREEN